MSYNITKFIDLLRTTTCKFTPNVVNFGQYGRLCCKNETGSLPGLEVAKKEVEIAAKNESTVKDGKGAENVGVENARAGTLANCLRLCKVIGETARAIEKDIKMNTDLLMKKQVNESETNKIIAGEVLAKPIMQTKKESLCCQKKPALSSKHCSYLIEPKSKINPDKQAVNTICDSEVNQLEKLLYQRKTDSSLPEPSKRMTAKSDTINAYSPSKLSSRIESFLCTTKMRTNNKESVTRFLEATKTRSIKNLQPDKKHSSLRLQSPMDKADPPEIFKCKSATKLQPTRADNDKKVECSDSNKAASDKSNENPNTKPYQIRRYSTTNCNDPAVPSRLFATHPTDSIDGECLSKTDMLCKKTKDPCKKKKKKKDPCKKKKKDPCKKKKKKKDPCKKKKKKKKKPCKTIGDPCKKKKKKNPCKKKKKNPCKKKKKKNPCKKPKKCSSNENPCMKCSSCVGSGSNFGSLCSKGAGSSGSVEEPYCQKWSQYTEATEQKCCPEPVKCCNEFDPKTPDIDDVLCDVDVVDMPAKCSKDEVDRYFGDKYKNKQYYRYKKYSYQNLLGYSKRFHLEETSNKEKYK